MNRDVGEFVGEWLDSQEVIPESKLASGYFPDFFRCAFFLFGIGGEGNSKFPLFWL